MGKLTQTKPEPRYGNIPGVQVGDCFEDRESLATAGLHAPPQAGIWYQTRFGAYSIVLNGGYEDDVDEGDRIVYTGHGKGGKGAETVGSKAPQQGHQEWKLGNLALKRSMDERRPVRVIRGSECKSNFAPKSGFRYDGLYRVTRARRELGKEGYWVCRFTMIRLPNQSPIPVQSAVASVSDVKTSHARLPTTPSSKHSSSSSKLARRVVARSKAMAHIHSPTPKRIRSKHSQTLSQVAPATFSLSSLFQPLRPQLSSSSPRLNSSLSLPLDQNNCGLKRTCSRASSTDSDGDSLAWSLDQSDRGLKRTRTPAISIVRDDGFIASGDESRNPPQAKRPRLSESRSFDENDNLPRLGQQEQHKARFQQIAGRPRLRALHFAKNPGPSK
ncbi:PUA-like domain-containing protein [Mycena amicta]|nr:PUA-like domain-containing protein [Mycena amicta]